MTEQTHIHTFHSGSPQPGSSSAANTFTSIDPSTALPLATIYTSTPTQLNDAIASAQSAFKTWSNSPPQHRATILLRAAAILRERNSELALTESMDTGRAIFETSTVDVITSADVLEYYAHHIWGCPSGQYTRIRPAVYMATSYEAMGVCAGIGAWNYPLQIAVWKSAPCLAAGNCMVYKPSEITPLHAGTLAQIYMEAGLPAGVFNVVYGDGSGVGAPLVSHPGIAKVSFTGQVSTGSKVASEAAKGMKSITMELGGKSPLIILPDADIDEAADVAMAANFFSAGQVCTNGTRVFVPDCLLSQIEDAVVKRCRRGIRMGLPTDPKTNFGPVVSAAQRDKINKYVNHGIEKDGARILYNGHADSQQDLPSKDGFWVSPVVFTDCTDGMRVACEEIFGPVMCILPYSTIPRTQRIWLAELIQRANNTDMGLAAGVVSSDLGLAQDVVQQLDAGITWINTWGESPAQMPAGGWKMSGIGVENGPDGIRAYQRLKSTVIQNDRGACRGMFAPL